MDEKKKQEKPAKTESGVYQELRKLRKRVQKLEAENARVRLIAASDTAEYQGRVDMRLGEAFLALENAVDSVRAAKLLAIEDHAEQQKAATCFDGIRLLIEKVELNEYECQAGRLELCKDWQDLRMIVGLSPSSKEQSQEQSDE